MILICAFAPICTPLAGAITNAAKMIIANHLTKTYITDNGHQHALMDVNFHVTPGEIYGIIGRSGAGKTTLLHCINGLETPSSGSLIVDGVEMSAVSGNTLRQARRKMGMIFQHFHLLNSRTVYQNIALPLEIVKLPQTQIHQRVMDLLEFVQLADKQNSYPTQLSGGQKQRVAIARALAHQPHVLLCDEATSALDPETTQAILALLQTINREFKLTIVLITHEMDVIKQICHRVALLEQGHIIEQANTIDFFTQPISKLAHEFVKNSLRFSLPETLQQEMSTIFIPESYPVYQLAFVGQHVEQPFMTQLFRRFAVQANIWQARIETIQQQIVGVMIVQLIGHNENITAAEQFLYQQNIKIERIAYVKYSHSLAD